MSAPDRTPSPAARTSGLSAEERAALIARLADQLAAVPVTPVAEPSAAIRAAQSDARPESRRSERSERSDGRRSDSPRDTRRTGAGMVGAADRRRDRRPEGGHPEDAPGDPAAVARQICLRQLAASAKPRAALADVLRRRGIPDDVADAVLDRFTEVGLIDDVAYAAAYVSTKQRDRALGAGALRVELRRKGLADAVVVAAVADIDEADERERAADLVARRIGAAMHRGPVAARRRLVGMLARRGYSSALAYSVVSDALAAHGAVDDEPESDDALLAGPTDDLAGTIAPDEDHGDGDDDPGPGADAGARVDNHGAVGTDGHTNGSTRAARRRWPARSLRSR